MYITIQDTYPGDKKLKKHLRKLKKTINEGLKNKNTEYAFITASIVEVRHILEHILGQYWIKIGKGKVKADPFEQINELKNRGVLTKEQASFLHEVRLAANSEVHNSNKKITTMSDMVKLGNELSEFIFHKFKKDIPKKLSVRSRGERGGSKRRERIDTTSYRDRESFDIMHTETYAQACLDKHIISVQEYKRVLPAVDVRGLVDRSWEKDASLKKLHDKVVWEGNKIITSMWLEKRIQKYGSPTGWVKKEFNVAEKSRKKEAEYKKHDIPFLKIMLDYLYSQKIGAPWVYLRCSGVEKPTSLGNWGYNNWLFLTDIPEKRKEKIKRACKAAYVSAIVIDCLLILLMVAACLGIGYLLSRNSISGDKIIDLAIYAAFIGVPIFFYPAFLLGERIADLRYNFKKENRR